MPFGGYNRTGAMKEQPFKLLAGHTALDFANTVDDRYDPDRRLDLIARYEDLLRFCRQTDVLGAAEARNLEGLPERAKATALRCARELREVIERIFSSSARGRAAAGGDVERFNHFLASAMGHREVFGGKGMFEWRWRGLDGESEAPLWPIIFEAAELLVSADLKFVRECQDQTCGWLFLDLSKNHSRRWCDMKICGNRSKARRFYERQGEARVSS